MTEVNRNNNNNGKSKKSVPIAAIVGSIAAVLVALLCIVAIFYIRRRRRRRSPPRLLYDETEAEDKPRKGKEKNRKHAHRPSELLALYVQPYFDSGRGVEENELGDENAAPQITSVPGATNGLDSKKAHAFAAMPRKPGTGTNEPAFPSGIPAHHMHTLSNDDTFSLSDTTAVGSGSEQITTPTSATTPSRKTERMNPPAYSFPAPSSSATSSTTPPSSDMSSTFNTRVGAPADSLYPSLPDASDLQPLVAIQNDSADSRARLGDRKPGEIYRLNNPD